MLYTWQQRYVTDSGLLENTTQHTQTICTRMLIKRQMCN